MLTKERVIEMMEESRVYSLQQNTGETDRAFKHRVSARDNLINRLVMTSNAYDRIYEFMREASKKEPKGKEHLMWCFLENFLNTESHKLRKDLHIGINLPEGSKMMGSAYKKKYWYVGKKRKGKDNGR